MIKPTEEDIGRAVVYLPGHWSDYGQAEQGIITSFNESMVFVRYGDNPQSKATLRWDLNWLRPKEKPARVTCR